jgi:glycosyltransferase involved in cell wall biosynthesis
MAARDTEAYVDDSVRSILGQSFVDLELVVVDDASSDATCERLQAHADSDPRVRVLRNETNLGAMRSLNRAILHARGTLVAIMDSDDIAHRHRLARQVAYLDEHPEVGVVGALMDVLDQATGEVRPSLARADASWRDANNVMPHPTMLVRRDLYALHGMYDVTFPVAGDYELQARLASRGVQLHVLDEVLLRYRVHGTSTTALRRRAQVAASLRVSLRTVLCDRCMLSRRGWRSATRDAAIFVYLSLGLRRVVPYGLGKLLWPSR